MYIYLYYINYMMIQTMNPQTSPYHISHIGVGGTGMLIHHPNTHTPNFNYLLTLVYLTSLIYFTYGTHQSNKINADAHK